MKVNYTVTNEECTANLDSTLQKRKSKLLIWFFCLLMGFIFMGLYFFSPHGDNSQQIAITKAQIINASFSFMVGIVFGYLSLRFLIWTARRKMQKMQAMQVEVEIDNHSFVMKCNGKEFQAAKENLLDSRTVGNFQELIFQQGKSKRTIFLPFHVFSEQGLSDIIDKW